MKISVLSLLILTFFIPPVLQAESKLEVFDVHLHAVPPESFSQAQTANFGAHKKTATGIVNDRQLLLKKTIEYMDRNNVVKALVSGDKQMVETWVHTYPDRFLPSFSPDMTVQDHHAAAKQFEKQVEEGKWRAMGELGLPYEGLALNDPLLFPYYEICERKKIPVFFHTGLDGPNPQKLVSPKFRLELGDPLLLQDIVIRFPNLKVVIMHMGWPFSDHALYMLYAYPNVYLDTAVVNWILGKSVFDRMLKEAVDTVGSDRILFGSDQMAWPQMITPAVEAIKNADYLTENDKRRILYENANQLLNKVPAY